MVAIAGQSVTTVNVFLRFSMQCYPNTEQQGGYNVKCQHSVFLSSVFWTHPPQLVSPTPRQNLVFTEMKRRVLEPHCRADETVFQSKVKEGKSIMGEMSAMQQKAGSTERRRCQKSLEFTFTATVIFLVLQLLCCRSFCPFCICNLNLYSSPVRLFAFLVFCFAFVEYTFMSEPAYQMRGQ